MKTVAKVLLADAQGNMLALRRSSTHPHFAKQVDLPGGEVEDDEVPQDALTREIQEETGLELRSTQLELAYKEQKPKVLHLVFTAILDNSSPKVVLSWEHDRAQWLAKDQIVKKISKPGIDPYLKTVLDYLTQNVNSSGGDQNNSN